MRVFAKQRVWAPLRLALVATVAIASGCSPALAQDQDTWRCSTDYGTHREHREHIPRATRVLTGRILFHSGEVGQEWEPGAHIAFTDSHFAASSGCFCNGIRAEIYSDEPDIVKFFMIYNGREEGVAQAKVGIPITFRLSIDSRGVMTTTIGRTSPVSKSAQLMHPPRDTVFMDCSSGDVSFVNVRAG